MATIRKKRQHPAKTASLLATLLAAGLGLTACADDAVEPVPPDPPDPPVPTTVTVVPESAILRLPGETVHLIVTVQDQYGQAMSGVTVAWTSSDVSVATVSASGVVTATAVGTVTVTATADSASGSSEVTVEEHPDRAALVALYNGTDGPNWVDNTNWLTDAPLGDWYGVDTDASGRVVGLVVENNNLDGSLPPELGQLTGLFRLSLDGNELHGPIPPELGNLAQLTGLHLTRNELTGPIPVELSELTNLAQLKLRNNRLSGPIPTELGRLTKLSTLSLAWNGNTLTGGGLTHGIPPELGQLTSLSVLELEGNRLSQGVPLELGRLTNLRRLTLRYNRLEGAIPSSFVKLERLQHLGVASNVSLCIPGTSEFLAWLQGLGTHDATDGDLCNAADVAALKSLHGAAGGSGWIQSHGWLSEDAIGEWYGITADSLGRVAELDLARNGLAGRLPSTIGDLAGMTVLRIGHNSLTGRLPLSLANVELDELSYSGTDLCAPSGPAFQGWLNGIASHDGSGIECPPLSHRAILEIFYHAAGGRNWANSQGWMTEQALSDWYGVEIDQQGGVVTVQLSGNQLTGSIPPELGDLTSLRHLLLYGNGLTGSIPSELGSLSNLSRLYLYENDLSGPIPRELGRLGRLEVLHVAGNELSGSIPRELGDLASLRFLLLTKNGITGPIPSELGKLIGLEEMRLERNALTGRIPPELGRLRNLSLLDLSGNGLTGPIPSELGSLAGLRQLFLGQNDLLGSVPPDYAGMTNLQALALSNNPRMAGALPAELTVLAELDVLVAGETDLCAPADPGFQAWLAGVERSRIATCSASPSAAYLTQAVQSQQFPVPLVAGERALLRVFPTATKPTTVGLPAVRARFYHNGQETHVTYIPGKPTPIPTAIDEGSLAKSANAEIPADLVRPGLEMVIDVDPDGTLDGSLAVAKRIPEAGRLAVDVQDMPLLDLTLVPFIWTERQDRSIVDLVSAIAADPQHHQMLWETRTLLPVGDLTVSAHEPVASSSNNAATLLRETMAIRAAEGGGGYYMGTMTSPVTGASGMAQLSGRSSFSVPSGSTMAHELGHNLSLLHCPGSAAPDPFYPYADGSIGVWGYHFGAGGHLVHPATRDLMCGTKWISDYHFANALRFRIADAEQRGASGQPPARARSLLLWGGIGADGVPFLEPAFIINAPPALPDSSGDYQLTGTTTDGTKLFTLSFTMPETVDGDGGSSFAFVLPAPSRADALSSITLSGPDDKATLDTDSNHPMAILRDPVTGQVRGFLRGPPQEIHAAVDAAGGAVQGLEVLLSRGIPDAKAWWK